MPGLKEAFMDIRRDEMPLALLMFAYFFLVITCFWILKPLKKGLFVQTYDAAGLNLLGLTFTAAQAELLAKVLNMLVAFAAVVVFTALSRHFRRQQLTGIFSLFFIVCFGLFAYQFAAPSTATVWGFYLFGDLYSTLMVATFFAFLNDSVTSSAARRLYGLVGLGGVCGGVFGSSVVSASIGNISMIAWLWVCGGVTALIIVIAWLAGKQVRRVAPASPASGPKPATSSHSAAHNPPRGNVATEGARLVFSSPYLLSIVGIVGLYELISTIIDFQFTFAVAHYLDGEAIGRHFALVFSITNWVSLLVQVFLTGLVMNRLGLGVALLVLPLAIALGSTAFLVFPLLWVGSMLSSADNGFSYSINQSAKEALYVPTSDAEKYRAKAFIDMFVQRFAKAVAVLVSLGITFTVQDMAGLRYLGLVTLVLLVVWIVAARYAGRQFRQMEEAGA